MRRMTIVLTVALAASSIARAADPRFPDWPCNQIKVPELSVAAVWAGPPIDDVGKGSGRYGEEEHRKQCRHLHQ